MPLNNVVALNTSTQLYLTALSTIYCLFIHRYQVLRNCVGLNAKSTKLMNKILMYTNEESCQEPYALLCLDRSSITIMYKLKNLPFKTKIADLKCLR